MAPYTNAKSLYGAFMTRKRDGTATVEDAETTWDALSSIIDATYMRYHALSAVSADITPEMEQLRQENNDARLCMYNMYEPYQDVLSPGCLPRTWATLPMSNAIDPSYHG